MGDFKCEALIIKEGNKNRTRCNTPFSSFLDSLELVFCDKCKLEIRNNPAEKKLRTKKENKEIKSCINRYKGYACLKVTSSEDRICRECRSRSKLKTEKNSTERKVWEFILGVIFAIFLILLIVIMQQQAQKSRYSEIDNGGRYDDSY